MPFIAKSIAFEAASGQGYNVDTTGGDVVVTLPAASAIKGPIVFLNSAGANNIALQGTINGATNYNVPPGKSAVLSSDGAVMYISGGNS